MRNQAYFVANLTLALFFVTLPFFANIKKTDKPKMALGKASSNDGATFTENKGQVHDQNFKPRPDVLFGGHVGELVYHLRKTGVSYQLKTVASWKKNTEFNNAVKAQTQSKKSNLIDSVPAAFTMQRVDIDWLNCSPNATIVKDESLPGYSNFINSACPGGMVNEVRSYTGVTYKNIYNRIDLHYYSHEGNLKYDFIVAPHANYHQIKLQINGASDITINQQGGITIVTPLGNIDEGAPLVFQQGKQLKASWILTNKVLSLDIKNYNPEFPLIIDPITRIWGTYWGSFSQDGLWGTTSDGAGNLYVVGGSGASTGTAIATTGAYQTTYAGGVFDAVVAKFTLAGARVWSTYYGDAADDQGLCISYASSGHVYISGVTSSTTGIITNTATAHQPVYGGGPNDAFLAKFTVNTGTLSWSTYYGDAGDESAWNCPVDGSGDVYLCGSTSSTLAVLSSTNGHQQASGGLVDAFLVKFNSSGVRQWATFYGDTGNEDAGGAAVDGSGNVYLSGTTTSTLTPTVIATSAGHQTVNAGGRDNFLVKFSSAGARQWGTFYGESGYNELDGSCATDALGNVYLCGTTSGSSTALATVGAYLTTAPGGISDVFLVKFNGSGVRQWATYYGGPGNEAGNISTVSTDGLNNVYVTGTSNSTSGIAITGGFQTFNAGDYDGYFVQLDPGGTPQYATYYGGAGGEFAKNTYIDGLGNIFVTGTTYTTPLNPGGSTSGIASPGAFRTFFSGDVDGYLVRIADCSPVTTPTNSTPGGNQLICSGRGATLTANSSSGTIFWYTSPTSNFTVGSGPTYTTPNLSTGTFNYYAGAVSSCTASTRVAITVTVLSSPSIFASSGAICPGNNFTFSPTGSAVNFTINNGTSNFTLNSGGSATVSPAATTIYTITGTGANGCTNSGTGAVRTVTVHNPTYIFVNSGLICLNGSFTITPTGASTYTYSSGSAVVSPSVTTSYSVMGTSSLGCVSAAPAISNVTVQPLPVISVNSGTICQGAAFNIVPGGANTYTFSGGSSFVFPTTNTVYSVTGSDVYGCVSPTPAISSVVVNTVPIVSVNGNSVFCSGLSTTLSASGASTYTWSNSGNGTSQVISTTVSTLPYTLTPSLTGSSPAGCTNTAAITLTIYPRPVISVNSGSICSGKSFTIIPLGANIYTLSSGANVVTPTASLNTYTVTGMNSLGCASSNTAISNVSVVPLPTVSISGASLVCSGTPISFTASGATTYTWSNNVTTTMVTVSPTVSSNYTVTGRLAGCTNSAVTSVSVLPLPNLGITGPTGVCQGVSAVLTGTGASTYSWSIGSGNSTVAVTPSITTVYTLTGNDSFGCVKTVTRTVLVNSLPSLTVTGPGSVCPGGSAVLQVAGANTFTWNTGSNSGAIFVTPTLATTIYSVSGSSAANCTVMVTKQISLYTPPVITTNSLQSVCAGSQATLNGAGGVTYTWTGGVTNNTPFTPVVTKDYTVTGTDANGCTNKATATVIVNAVPVLTINTTALRICVKETATLSVIGAISYSWNNGSPNDSIFVSPVLSTNYSVTGTDQNGCVGSSVYSLTVLACTGIDAADKGKILTILPNPTSGIIHILLEPAYLELNPVAEVFNALGQKVFSGKITSLNTAIDLDRFDNGMYVISLTTSEGTVNKRILKNQ